MAISLGAGGGNRTSLIIHGATEGLEFSCLPWFGKIAWVWLHFIYLITWLLVGGGIYGRPAHKIGLGGGSSFFLGFGLGLGFAFLALSAFFYYSVNGFLGTFI